jgi:hypothetical protein
VPAVITDAKTRGSGKSLLVHSIYRLVTGRDAPVMTWPGDDAAELEKILAGFALSGAALANFDNVSGRFGGGPLDKVLTATDTVQLRVLGRSEVPTLPWRAVIFASGNNFEVYGDTTRRVLRARLESPLEHPEGRSGFRHPNLLPWIGEHRARLVRAALTVLRAYVVAGRPDLATGAWGSFEAWAGLVPGAIRFAGGPNVLDARPSLTDADEDPEKVALATVLEHWPDLSTVRHALDAMYSGMPSAGLGELRTALETQLAIRPGQQPSSRQVGDFLKRHRGRVVRGRALRSQSAMGGVQRWRVVPVSGSSGSSG